MKRKEQQKIDMKFTSIIVGEFPDERTGMDGCIPYERPELVTTPIEPGLTDRVRHASMVTGALVFSAISIHWEAPRAAAAAVFSSFQSLQETIQNLRNIR